MEPGSKRTGQTVEVQAGEHDSLREDGRRLRTAARDGSGTVSGEHECPVCGYGAGTQSGVYLHLQIDHRKSELARTLLETDG